MTSLSDLWYGEGSTSLNQGALTVPHLLLAAARLALTTAWISVKIRAKIMFLRARLRFNLWVEDVIWELTRDDK